MVKLLLVEDNEGLREQMKWALAADYQVFEAETLVDTLRLYLKERPGVVCLDMGLENRPDRGLDIIDSVLKEDRMAKIVVITSNTDIELGRKSVERGAFDFLQKPVDIEELRVILGRANRLTTLEKPEEEVATGLPSDEDYLMVGQSAPMVRLFELIRKLSQSDVNVLITGESGTGKELCARALHYHSPRRGEVFVPINCGSIPATLMESELFGYARGAFTGAVGDKRGLIESAHKGTLFLDEIGEMPLALQVKLLRFLEDQKVQRLGDTQLRQVDVRVVAATNRQDLGEKNNESMRSDLYYRLSEFEVHLPALRDRIEDLPVLAQHIIERGRVKFAQPRLRLSKRAEKMLLNYGWPGNVRELENKLNRASITCKGSVIEPEDLQLSETAFKSLDYREARQMFDRHFILNALKMASGNVSQAAKSSGLTRPTFYDMMKKAGVSMQMEAKLDSP